MTPITYDQAAKLLDVSINSLRSAAARGILTRLPRTGQKQPLIKEQVILFLGKPRLSLYVLDKQEKEAWNKYAQAGAKAAQEEQAKKTESSVSPEMLIGAALAGAALASAMPKNAEVPQGNPFRALANLLRNTQ